MAYKVEVLADSVSPQGNRLTTFELTYPRFIHSEFMTHRMMSRNAASSRAIPVDKMLYRVKNEPASPVYWGMNKAGMQSEVEMDEPILKAAKMCWINARDDSVTHATRLRNLNAHKQIANRLLEPWMWITVICTATEYANFFHLRAHPAAQPEFQKLAYMMKEAYEASIPSPQPFLGATHTHLPLLKADEAIGLLNTIELSDLPKVSVGRCARVSYLTHDGKRDPQADIELCDRLLQSRHLSPFEHVARPFTEEEWTTVRRIQHEIRKMQTIDKTLPNYGSDKDLWYEQMIDQCEFNGNLRGWVSIRKQYQNENVKEMI